MQNYWTPERDEELRRLQVLATLEDLDEPEGKQDPKGKKVLVVADLHLGLEASLRKVGMHLPSQTNIRTRHILDVLGRTKAKRLVLFHHDPMHDDDFLDRVVASCRTYMHEQGMTFECSAGADCWKVSI